MGIQLTDFNREMIKTVIFLREADARPASYYLGYLQARVDQFLSGGVTREQLADDAAFLNLLQALDARCSTQELKEIVAGTKEIPGEDVHDGQ